MGNKVPTPQQVDRKKIVLNYPPECIAGTTSIECENAKYLEAFNAFTPNMYISYFESVAHRRMTFVYAWPWFISAEFNPPDLVWLESEYFEVLKTWDKQGLLIFIIGVRRAGKIHARMFIYDPSTNQLEIAFVEDEVLFTEDQNRQLVDIVTTVCSNIMNLGYKQTVDVLLPMASVPFRKDYESRAGDPYTWAHLFFYMYERFVLGNSRESLAQDNSAAFSNFCEVMRQQFFGLPDHYTWHAGPMYFGPSR